MTGFNTLTMGIMFGIVAICCFVTCLYQKTRLEEIEKTWATAYGKFVDVKYIGKERYTQKQMVLFNYEYVVHEKIYCSTSIRSFSKKQLKNIPAIGETQRIWYNPLRHDESSFLIEKDETVESAFVLAYLTLMVSVGFFILKFIFNI